MFYCYIQVYIHIVCIYIRTGLHRNTELESDGYSPINSLTLDDRNFEDSTLIPSTLDEDDYYRHIHQPAPENVLRVESDEELENYVYESQEEIIKTTSGII